MKECLVSIIVPIYNVEAYISRTIESVLAQTYANFELILVNDGSTDSSGEICDQYAAMDNRIKVFHQSNAGAAAARKYGVEQALGEWLMFVDGDDMISIDCLESLLKLDNNKYDIISGTIIVNNKYVYHHDYVGEISNEKYISLLLESRTFTGPVAKLIKRSIWKKHVDVPRYITNNEDMLMLINIATQCKKVYLDNSVICYHYLHRKNSASKSVTMPFEIWLELFNLIKEELADLLANNNIQKSYIKYQLRRLYLCCILKGKFVDCNNPNIVTLINKCDECDNLDLYDNKVIQLIKNFNKQKKEYKKHIIKNYIKRTIKNLFRIK